MIEQYTNLIGGRWIDASSGERYNRPNPADDAEIIGSFPNMDSEDVEAAVQHAVDAARPWRDVGVLERGRVLIQAASLIRERLEQLAADLSREMGKTLSEARGEVASAAAFFEYNGGLARHPAGDLLADKRPGVRGWAQREPVGVVCLITPWNDPAATPARKLGPALLCGNTVVLKPAPETPLAARHLIEALHDAGAHPGSINLVTGDNDRVGPPLVANREITAISFTGSTPVGRYLEEQLAGTGTRLQTEMGGKNAVLVLKDADLDEATDAIISAGFGQTGQRCTATSRVVIERVIADDLRQRLATRIGQLTIGPGTAEGTDVGPLVSSRQLERVTTALDGALADGASIVCGGGRPSGDYWDRGYFLEPTLVTNVTSDAAVWQEEIFGPVVALMSVDSYEEGIHAVNNSTYGLSASIFTSSLAYAHRFVDEVQTGQVSINLPTTGWDVHVPFGGFKDSGSPFKEHGVGGLHFYSRVKSVMMKPT